ncbi:hypothetical protein [Streptomyces roseolus]|uniref:hypothetical protein n=1 Tax=Streptomyces roseolus TaxID=67358 RepID=UPI0036E6E746
MVSDEANGTAGAVGTDTGEAAVTSGTAVLLAAAPAGRGRTMDAASVLPALAAVPPGVLTGTATATLVELADPIDPQTVLTRLRAAAQSPGPLVVYLAGQLHLDRRQQLPHLALARSTTAALRYTAFPWHWLAEAAASGPTTVVADLVADPEAWARLGTGPDLLRLSPSPTLYARVTPPPRRGERTTPDYLRAWADQWRAGARAPFSALHAESAARTMSPRSLFLPPAPSAGEWGPGAGTAAPMTAPTPLPAAPAPASVRAPAPVFAPAPETGPGPAPAPETGLALETGPAPAPARIPATAPEPVHAAVAVPESVAAASAAPGPVTDPAAGPVHAPDPSAGRMPGGVPVAEGVSGRMGGGTAAPASAPEPVRVPVPEAVPAPAGPPAPARIPPLPAGYMAAPPVPDHPVAEAPAVSGPPTETQPADGTGATPSAAAPDGPADVEPELGPVGEEAVPEAGPMAAAEGESAPEGDGASGPEAERELASASPSRGGDDGGSVPVDPVMPAGVVSARGGGSTAVPAAERVVASAPPSLGGDGADGGSAPVNPAAPAEDASAPGADSTADPAAKRQVASDSPSRDGDGADGGSVPAGPVALAVDASAPGRDGTADPAAVRQVASASPSRDRGGADGGFAPVDPVAPAGGASAPKIAGAAAPTPGTGAEPGADERRAPVPLVAGEGEEGPGTMKLVPSGGRGTGRGIPPMPSVPPTVPAGAVDPRRAGYGQSASAEPAPHDPHPAILSAAMAGRHAEAAEMAAAWERDALRRFGPRSAEAVHWMEVRADLARLAGEPARSCELWLAVAEARLGLRQQPDDRDVEGAVDRAHHQWEQITEPARARALGPTLLALRRRVPGRRPGALEALRRRMHAR